jgi:hypothetical protein
MKRALSIILALVMAACSAPTNEPEAVDDDATIGGGVDGSAGTDSGGGDDTGGTDQSDGSSTDGGQSDGSTTTDTGGDDGSALCQTPFEFFETKLWPQLMGVKCLVCHNPEGIAKDTKMVFHKPGVPDFMQTNFEAAKAVAEEMVAGTPLLLLKPTNLHPLGHTGGQQVKKSDPEYAILVEFVGRVLGEVEDCEEAPVIPPPNCDEVAPGQRQLRRLSRFEYDQTVSDLLHITSVWGKGFTTEKYINGFDNNGQALTVSPLLAEQLRKAAEELAKEADIDGLLPCDPIPGQQNVCAEEFIASFGMRAFRRPLTDKEVKAYKKIFDLVFFDDGFTEGAQFVIAAFLQSPHFLYRTELGEHQGQGLFVLTAFEIASQLSYLIWGSMPDQELFDAAASGALLEPAEILKQAQRLLAADKSNALFAHFAKHWLETHRLPYQAKDMDAYPDLNYEIRLEMLGETARFLAHLVHTEGGTLPEIFTAKYSFMTDNLASFYQMDGPSGDKDSNGFGQVNLPATQYRGLLTQASVTTSHAYPDQSSPIHRGKFVRERLLCQHLPPPPPGIIVNVPAVDPNLSTRERFAAHSEKEPCNSCHKLIDPVGFAFEHYTGDGRYRDKDGTFEIDATGYINNTPATNGTFDGILELGQHLSQSPDVHNCYALQWVRYGYGLEENEELACLIQDVQKGFVDSNLELAALLKNLTQTVHFRFRIGNPDEIIEGGDDGGDDTGDDGADDVGADDGGEPFEPQPLNVDFKKDSEWDTGYCASVKVTNLGDDALTWKFKLAVDGQINQIWNASTIPIPDSDELFFVGVDWNAEIGPGASTDFGFCAAL